MAKPEELSTPHVNPLTNVVKGSELATLQPYEKSAIYGLDGRLYQVWIEEGPEKGLEECMQHIIFEYPHQNRKRMDDEYPKNRIMFSFTDEGLTSIKMRLDGTDKQYLMWQISIEGDTGTIRQFNPSPYAQKVGILELVRNHFPIRLASIKNDFPLFYTQLLRQLQRQTFEA